MTRKTAKRSARKVVRRSARKVVRRSARKVVRRSARKVVRRSARRSGRRYRVNPGFEHYAKGSNDDVTGVHDPLRRPISRVRMPYRPRGDIPTFNDGRDILAEYDARYRREKAPAMVPPPEFLRPRRVEVEQDDQVEEKGLLSKAVDAVKGFFSRPARHPHVMHHSPVARRSPVRQPRF